LLSDARAAAVAATTDESSEISSTHDSAADPNQFVMLNNSHGFDLQFPHLCQTKAASRANVSHPHLEFLPKPAGDRLLPEMSIGS